MRRAARFVVLLAGLTGAAALTWLADAAEGLERLPAVLHLHSDLSTGDFSLEQLAAMAEASARCSSPRTTSCASSTGCRRSGR